VPSFGVDPVDRISTGAFSSRAAWRAKILRTNNSPFVGKPFRLLAKERAGGRRGVQVTPKPASIRIAMPCTIEALHPTRGSSGSRFVFALR
jgi:hypothetical protein